MSNDIDSDAGGSPAESIAPAADAPSSAPASAPAQPGEFEALNTQMRQDPDAWAKNAGGRQRWMDLWEAGQGEGKADEGQADTSVGPEPLPVGRAHPYRVPAPLANDWLAQDFARSMDVVGMPHDVVNGALDWAAAGMHHEEFAGRDGSDRELGKAELRSLWKGNYEKNLAEVRAYIAGNMPHATGALLMKDAVRLKDGRSLGSSPEFLIRLHGLAQRAPKMPASTGDINADIKAIESVMRTDPEGYRRDENLQLRLRALYDERIKRKG